MHFNYFFVVKINYWIESQYCKTYRLVIFGISVSCMFTFSLLRCVASTFSRLRLCVSQKLTLWPKNTHLSTPILACQNALKLAYSNVKFQKFSGGECRRNPRPPLQGAGRSWAHRASPGRGRTPRRGPRGNRGKEGEEGWKERGRGEKGKQKGQGRHPKLKLAPPELFF